MVDLKKVGVVFRREFLERVRTRWFLIGTLLGPIFFGTITVLPTYMSAKQRPSDDLANIRVLDGTGTALGERVVASLRKQYPLSPAPKLESISPADLGTAEDRAVKEVMRRERKGVLVLDSATIAGDSVRYLGRNASSLNDVQELVRSVNRQVLALRLQTAGLDPQRVDSLTNVRLKQSTQKVSDNGREKGGGLGNVLLGYFMAILLYMMIAIYGQAILRAVLEEKTTRVAEVVVSSVTPDTLLAGKVIGVGLVAVTQVLSWVALTAAGLMYLGPILFGGGAARQVGAQQAAQRGIPTEQLTQSMTAALPSLGTGLMILCYFVLGFLFFASLFAAVGAMVSSQEDVQQAQMPVMLLLISSVIFMSPIMMNPASGFARVMSILPFSAPILMPLRMSLVPVPAWEIALSLGLVILACLGAIWLSARIYRVGLLMYGKRPTYAELARWIRYSG